MIAGLLALGLSFAIQLAPRAELSATPGDYLAALPRLAPGTTLRLAPGRYGGCLHLRDLHGTASAPIVITGPEDGPPAIFLAAGCRGSPGHGGATIRICDSSHVVIRRLELDGQHLDVHGVEAGHCSSGAEHITLEGLEIHDHDANQQIDGISTKTPAWGWIIRHNRIIHAGTGIYLGNSLGDDPFVGGIIEDNEVLDPIGYALQIKHQLARPGELPQDPSVTVIRRNTFAKRARASFGKDARPNLLVGHPPQQGPGSEDRFEIYGNLLLENASDLEPLFQGEGNLSFHDNLLFNDHRGPAIEIRAHHALPRKVRIYRNTIVAAGAGVVVREGDPAALQLIIGNAIFAREPLRPGPALAWDNLEASRDEAERWLLSPRAGALDLRPRILLDGPPIDLADLPPADDFDGAPHAPGDRGAFAWPLSVPRAR